MPKIYLDNQSTTAVDRRVMETMLPYYLEKYGNPASRNHMFGWEADEAVVTAREQVAKLIGSSSSEIIFTSGATESDNLAIKGIACGNRHKGNHIITVKTEHKAVLDPCAALEKEGFSVTFLPVGRDGLLDLKKLAQAISPETILVSVMHANNEIGVIQPIAEIAQICREKGVLLHTDAAQSAGKIPVDVRKLNVDLLSLSAHKMYGPKGVGALYIRKTSPKISLKPLIHGGGHERGVRSGTLPVPLIAGFGKACELSLNEMESESARITRLRNRLLERITRELDGVKVNGSISSRLPGNLNLAFQGIHAESLIMAMPDIAISTGSACTSSVQEPSYVLKALGLSRLDAYASIRIGIGRFNSDQEIDRVIGKVIETVKKLRGQSGR